MSLYSRASQIKNETAAGGNTANRVGSLLEDIVSELNSKVSNATHSGDVTGDTVLTIADGVVSNSKLAEMPNFTLKGNISGVSDIPSDLTPMHVRYMLNVEDGATANSSDSFLLDRANHTGVQEISTVSGLESALDSKKDLINLDFSDFWVENWFTHNNRVQSNVIGSAISSGTISTAIPASSLNGKFPTGVFIRSSTTANGGYRFQTTSLVSDYFGVASHKFRCIFQSLTSFVNRTVRIGYLDTTSVSDAVDGAYFEIVGGVAACKTASNSVRTTNATTVVLSLTTHYMFDIEVDSLGTQVRFRIWDADTSTLILDVVNTTNIPNSSSRTFGSGIVATESSTTASNIGVLKYLAWGTINGFNKISG